MWEHPSITAIEKLKQKYKDLYPKVQLLVNQWDPVGLIGGGAPQDEYDCISVQLIELLLQGKKSSEMYDFIVHELDDHFGMGITSIPDEYKEQFIQKHTRFSEQITSWYEQYKSTIS